MLYPCDRYSPAKCLICGGNFRDHLTLKWAKLGLLYTPFDRILDRIYEKGVHLEEASQDIAPRRRWWFFKQRSRDRPTQSVYTHDKHSDPVKYAFHQQYVRDETEYLKLLKDSKSSRRSRQARRLARQREFHQVDPESDLAYSVPSLMHIGAETEGQNTGKKRKRRLFPSLTVIFARICVIDAIDRLIRLQRLNEDLDERERHTRRQQIL